MPNERHYSNELNLESVGINLPYNMQAEQSVLGAVLLKPETLTDLVEIIRPEMFYTRQNAQIYSEMLRLFTADQTIDFVTLLDAVISDGVFPSADEAKVYLTGLAETVPSISNVKAYAQIVQEKYLVRQLMGVAKDILQDAGDEPDADLLLENAEQRIYEIRSGRDSSALTPLSSSMVETLTNLQKISGPDADKYKGIPTGFRLLDTVLTGLGRGDLIILAARPGMGKTSFALNIATRVACGISDDCFRFSPIEATLFKFDFQCYKIYRERFDHSRVQAEGEYDGRVRAGYRKRNSGRKIE